MAYSLYKYNNFRFYFPVGFFYDEIIEAYSKYFKTKNIPFAKLTEYVNHTIKSINFPGLSDSGSPEQTSIRQKRGFTSAVHHSERLTKKTLDITFSMEEGLLNWMILFQQLSMYTKGEKETFLPDCYFEVYDSDGVVLFHASFSQIRLLSISDINFDQSNDAISGNTFTVQIAFNNMVIKNMLLETFTK